MPAQATAPRVIASAMRLIEVRQSCRSSSRIAEIRVPACPMPIHQTKLMIAKPQAFGMLMPQMPTPFQNSQPTATMNIPSTMNDRPNARYHQRGVRSWTMAVILSVIVAGVWRGSSTTSSGGSATPPRSRRSRSRVAMLGRPLRGRGGRGGRGMGELRARVGHAREIGGPRPGVEIVEHAVVERARLPALDLRRRTAELLGVEVAEHDRLGRARLLAGGLQPLVGDRLAAHLRVDLGVLDALHAVSALLHHAAHPHRH